MTIALKPETQRLLEDKLRDGSYQSADDVIHAALEALDQVAATGLDDATLDAIDRAEDQIDRGQLHDWSAVRAQVRAKFAGE